METASFLSRSIFRFGIVFAGFFFSFFKGFLDRPARKRIGLEEKQLWVVSGNTTWYGEGLSPPHPPKRGGGRANPVASLSSLFPFFSQSHIRGREKNEKRGDKKAVVEHGKVWAEIERYIKRYILYLRLRDVPVRTKVRGDGIAPIE